MQACQKQLKAEAFASAISGDHDVVVLTETMGESVDEMGKSPFAAFCVLRSFFRAMPCCAV